MLCRRCRGWMVLEQLMDLHDDTGRGYCEAWRCLNCGAIVDPVIVGHAVRPPEEPMRSTRRWRTPLVTRDEIR